MNNLLLPCAHNVHFTFGNDIYQQKNGVTMGSSLGPVLAEIFRLNLERVLMPKQVKCLKPWKIYVDDIITSIKPAFITDFIKILNKFHENIKFTYEIERNGKISFLGVLLMRSK